MEILLTWIAEQLFLTIKSTKKDSESIWQKSGDANGLIRSPQALEVSINRQSVQFTNEEIQQARNW